MHAAKRHSTPRSEPPQHSRPPKPPPAAPQQREDLRSNLPQGRLARATKPTAPPRRQRCGGRRSGLRGFGVRGQRSCGGCVASGRGRTGGMHVQPAATATTKRHVPRHGRRCRSCRARSATGAIRGWARSALGRPRHVPSNRLGRSGIIGAVHKARYGARVTMATCALFTCRGDGEGVGPDRGDCLIVRSIDCSLLNIPEMFSTSRTTPSLHVCAALSVLGSAVSGRQPPHSHARSPQAAASGGVARRQCDEIQSERF